MEEISLDVVNDRWTSVEAAVDATPGIDPWCSGPDWLIPVTLGFAPTADHLLLATDDDDGYALFARYRTATGVPMLGGLEPLWGFGCPVIGQDTRAIADGTAEVLAGRSLQEWRLLYLPGLPPIGHPDRDDPESGADEAAATDIDRPITSEDPDEDSNEEPIGLPPVVRQLATALSRVGRVRLGTGITRQVADLGDGHDAWLARRSPRFRRNLRQAEARAEAAGLQIIDVSDDPELYPRILAMEHASWKGREGSGITTPEMAAMYRMMIDRLQARGRLHAHLARLDGRDVGYILGGIRGRRYRGLQISYTDPARRLSVGNLLQRHQLTELHRQDLADVYDLGMDFDYKRRWADRAEPSTVLLVERL
ncbi:MAG: GNAT family N-acetyltransferase [Actinomycetota bacterium]